MMKRSRVLALTLGIAMGVATAWGMQAAVANDGGSLGMWAATQFLKLRGKSLGDPDSFRAKILSRRAPTPAEPPHWLTAEVDVTEERIDGQRVVALTPKVHRSRWHILYLHGGAYVNDVIAAHYDIVSALIEATGATVSIPVYPLAPEHNNRDAFPFLIETYRHLVRATPAANLVIAGDSAGGGLAVGLSVTLRERKLPLPAQLVLFSPWLDLTLPNPAARAIEPHDPMLAVDAARLCGAWWAAGDNPRLPRLSPLYADLKGLPPMLLFQGDHDILMPDARSFTAKVRAAGGKIDYREYAGGFHVFVGAPRLPESQDVYRHVAETMR